MSGYRPLILLVEDDPDVQHAMSRVLTRAGHVVIPALTAATAVTAVTREHPDLMLLDLGLPDARGETVIERLTAAGVGVPFIVVSSATTVDTKSHMFRLGARDYVTKPFELEELLARISAVLSREISRGTIHRGGLVLDPRRCTVSRDGRLVTLPPLLFSSLVYLLGRLGEEVGWEELAAHIWMHTPDVRSNTVHVHVSRLRRVLALLQAPLCLRTIRHRGVALESASTGVPFATSPSA